MHNAADDPAFIHSRFSRECRSADAVQAARIDRHSARNDLDPLQVPPSGTLNQKMRWLGIPFMGPHPNRSAVAAPEMMNVRLMTAASAMGQCSRCGNECIR